jgi:hypothetical protein
LKRPTDAIFALADIRGVTPANPFRRLAQFGADLRLLRVAQRLAELLGGGALAASQTPNGLLHLALNGFQVLGHLSLAVR